MSDDTVEIDIPPKLKYMWFKDVKDRKKLKRLRLTRYAMYATSLPDHTEFLLDVLKCYFKNLRDLTVTDATACIGGNSRIFVGKFKHTNIVDISKLHIDILKHNFEVLGLGRVGGYTIINKNYLTVGPGLKQDIIFVDAPWGGVDYKIQNNKSLYLKDEDGKTVDINDLIRDTLHNEAKMIVLKVPKTYDTSAFDGAGLFKYIKTVNVLNRGGWITYSMVILSNVEPFKDVPESRVLSSVNYRAVLNREKKTDDGESKK
jgi:hypothetical protein